MTDTPKLPPLAITSTTCDYPGCTDTATNIAHATRTNTGSKEWLYCEDPEHGPVPLEGPFARGLRADGQWNPRTVAEGP